MELYSVIRNEPQISCIEKIQLYPVHLQSVGLKILTMQMCEYNKSYQEAKELTLLSNFLI